MSVAASHSRRMRLPPCVVLGGSSNALSVVRSLGRRRVPVLAITDDSPHVRFSRFGRWIPVPSTGNQEADWTAYLLGPQSEPLRGAVLLACSDAALLTIARNREALAQKFRLDDSHVPAQLCMLNKLCTYQAALEAGVPTPRFWVVRSVAEAERVRGELAYPLLVKPHFSHKFTARFGRKFLTVDRYEDLIEALTLVEESGLETMLVEQIPGPDSRLCSYYTYLPADGGEPLFHFTKRIIRRFPVGMGNGCYHITDQVPGVRELGLRLFRQVGLVGLANVEFKLDERDGQLKLIECNARFTAANGLVAASGLDLAWLVYSRLVGLPLPPLDRYCSGVRLWYPLDDFRAYRTLRQRGELTFWGWLRSVAHWQTFPYFQWSDPLPTLGTALLASPWLSGLARRVQGLLRAVRGLVRRPQQPNP